MKPQGDSPLLRALATFVGLLAALAVVWFVGPVVAINGVILLDGQRARWIAMAAMIGVAVVLAVWRGARSSQNNRRLLQGMVADSAAQTSAPLPGENARKTSGGSARGAQEVELLGERFERAVSLLKRRVGSNRSWLGVFGGQPYLYELPWYIIIGAPGAGKTTALVKSGLEFPLEAQVGEKMIRGVGGTRNCDWWFTTDAVLIDTAGRYTTQDSDQAADRTAWLGFLDLLARNRPGRPINGVLLTLSVSDLLNPDAAKRVAHARALRQRVDELHARLGIRLPIYVLVTKTDLLAGFVEFFADFDKDERAQVWGVTFPYSTEEMSDDPLARMPGDLAALESRLNERLIDRLQSERDRSRRPAIYAFPQQWRVLHQTLLELLPVIFGEATNKTRPLLRGLYFTSATQEGTPMDRAIGGLARALGLSSRIVAPSRSSVKTFFVTRLLRDVILKESGLAGTNLRWQQRRVAIRWTLGAAAAFLTAACVLLTWRVFENDRSRVAAAAERAAVLSRDVDAAKGAQITDLTALLPPMQSLKTMAWEFGAVDQPWPAWLSERMDQSQMLASASNDAYRRVLKDGFLPRIATRLEQRLRSGDADHLDRLYEDLKAYEMIFSGKNFDADQLRAFLRADWDVTLPTNVTVADRAALRAHLDALLAGGEVGAPSQADPQTVANARALISKIPLAQRVYGRLKQLDLGPDVVPFTVELAAGPRAARVFARASAQPLNQGVPGLYTRAVFQHSFRQRTQDVLRQLASEQSWVLGVSGATALEPQAQGKLLDDVQRMYVADYVRQWEAFVNDLRLVPSATLPASVDTLQILARVDSPLQALLQGIVREVSVAAPGAANDAARTGRADDSLIDPRFDPLRQFVIGQPPALQGTLAILGRLAAQLSAVDDAVKRGTVSPPSDAIRELSAEVPRAPVPVRAMLSQLAKASAAQAFAALREPINRQMADVNAVCAHVSSGRYPLARAGSQDISREEFTKTFATGGVLDSFFQRNLAPYVDTTTRPWVFRGADGSRGETSESLQDFQRAQSIRSSYFRDAGRTLGAPIEFKLLELDPAVKQLVLDVDGQVLRFGHDQKNSQSIQWPGPGGAGSVHLQMTSAGGGSGSAFSFEGPWALLRLFDRVRVEPGSATDRVQFVLDVEGHKARLEARSSTPVNPLLRRDMEQFQCPKRL
jgi:type VI secretion system protein ImpL